MISLGLKIDIISKLDDDISIYQNNFCSNYMINNVYIDIYICRWTKISSWNLILFKINLK